MPQRARLLNLLSAAACLAPAALAAGPDPAASIFAPDPVERCLRPGAVHHSVAACFAPGTPEAYVNDFLARFETGADYFLAQRWSTTLLSGSTNPGDPTTVTYSFPSDSLGGIGGGTTSQNVLNQKMIEWFGSVAAGKAKFRQVFDRWESVSGLTYVEVSDDNAAWGAGGQLGVRGEIRIVSINIDGGSGVLAFNSFPLNGDMVIDSSEGYGGAFGDHVFFRNVVAHEAGHGFGLQHVCPAIATKLLEPFISIAYDGPQHDDIRAIQAHYGDQRENNDTVASATDVGVIPENFGLPGSSLDRNTDVDFVRFTIGPANDVRDIIVSPMGFVYNQASQSGGCGTGVQIDSNSVQDLAFDLMSADGSVVFATASAQPLGGIERIEGVAVTANTSYLLRVRSVGFSPSLGNQSQLYHVNIQMAPPPSCPGDANADDIVDFNDLNIVLGQFTQSGPGLPGDLNQDGVVNFLDLNLVLGFFGSSC